MSDTATPAPHALWAQADREYPNLPGRRRERYVELMREHGHIVSALDGDGDRNLPCGWPYR